MNTYQANHIPNGIKKLSYEYLNGFTECMPTKPKQSEQKYDEKHFELPENLNLSVFYFNVRFFSKNYKQLKNLPQSNVKFNQI